MAKTTEIFALAWKNLQAGAYSRAEQLYRQILQFEPSSADAFYLLGAACQAQGKLAEAEENYHRTLKLRPNHAAACNNLGVLLAHSDRIDQALECYRECLRLVPNYVEASNNLVETLIARGGFDEAIEWCRRALEFAPESAQLHFNLGAAQVGKQQWDKAAASYEQALQLRPEDSRTHYNLGVVLARLGRIDEAIKHYRLCVEQNPDDVEALNNLGNALRLREQYDDAMVALRDALRLRPDSAEIHSNLASVLIDQGKFDEAVAACQQALHINPRFAEAYNNLSNAFERQNRFEDAIRCNQDALHHIPNLAEAYNNIGHVYQQQGRLDDALKQFDAALFARPGHPEARWHRSRIWLLDGDFERGWPEFECRWQRPRHGPRPFVQPIWDGSPLEGRTILLHAEQGLGDTIQFIRYAELVKQRGGPVIVECQAPLVHILASVPGIDQLLPYGAPLPQFDAHAPLLSLPGIFHTSSATIPANVPYLRAHQDLIDHWKRLLDPLWGFKIGIAWQGNRRYRDDCRRSVPLTQFAPLNDFQGVRLISLQKRAGAEQLDSAADSMSVWDLGKDLDTAAGPFMDTAAVMKNIDLVICSDSAIAHLAGALGVPVWVALPLVPDWRWQLQREDSPWYPTMRLFRQTQSARWADVFRRIADELQSVMSQGRK